MLKRAIAFVREAVGLLCLALSILIMACVTTGFVLLIGLEEWWREQRRTKS